MMMMMANGDNNYSEGNLIRQANHHTTGKRCCIAVGICSTGVTVKKIMMVSYPFLRSWW